MRRGDIYFIANTHNCGAEIAKSRPAVIVSNDALNATSDVVEVVYLTTQPKREMFTHVEIYATGRPSTVLCEQISSVSKTRIGDYLGRCSERNMADIERALLASLGLTAPVEAREEQEEQAVPPPSAEPEELRGGSHPGGGREGRLRESAQPNPGAGV